MMRAHTAVVQRAALLGGVTRSLLLFGLLVLSACGQRKPNATPEGAVREVVERMRRVQGDPQAAKTVFELLSKRAQDNLTARAQRYGAASGRAIAPEAMLVPARFALRFEPQRYTPRISGPSAVVEVAGLDPSDAAIVPCVLEQGGWRVDLALPPLPVVQVRPGGDSRDAPTPR
jgi:hypothetical protein